MNSGIDLYFTRISQTIKSLSGLRPPVAVQAAWAGAWSVNQFVSQQGPNIDFSAKNTCLNVLLAQKKHYYVFNIMLLAATCIYREKREK